MVVKTQKEREESDSCWEDFFAKWSEEGKKQKLLQELAELFRLNEKLDTKVNENQKTCDSKNDVKLERLRLQMNL